jgi:CO dehydrogenase maturation factor
MLIVAEPYFKSLETARRYHNLATDLGISRVSIVANKVRDDEVDIVSDYCDSHGFNLIASVPFEAEFTAAERLGIAPMDHAPTSAGSVAVKGLADKMLALA